jgi:hypothetical protein
MTVKWWVMFYHLKIISFARIPLGPDEIMTMNSPVEGQIIIFRAKHCTSCTCDVHTSLFKLGWNWLPRTWFSAYLELNLLYISSCVHELHTDLLDLPRVSKGQDPFQPRFRTISSTLVYFHTNLFWLLKLEWLVSRTVNEYNIPLAGVSGRNRKIILWPFILYVSTPEIALKKFGSIKFVSCGAVI